MVSTPRQLRTNLQAIVAGVPDTGQVFAHLRYLSDWNQLLPLFKYTTTAGRSVFRGWWVGRSARSLPVPFGNPFAFDGAARPYTLALHGLSSLQDSTDSELDWEDVVDAVQDAIDDDTTRLGGLAVSGGVGPSVLTTWDERQYGSVLCHYAEVLVPAIVTRAVA